MISTLRQEISPHLLAQGLQGIELLVEELGPTAHAGFRYFAELFRTMARCVDGRTFAGNAPAPVESLEPIHLMRDINPHLAFSVSFLTNPKKHALDARPWKQWRLAGGEEEGKDVKT
jgi:hypothetical protein